MGLPGSGKTYLAERLAKKIDCGWFNADTLRGMVKDWDFSEEGRVRQSQRMSTFADFEESHDRNIICDFICPTEETRREFDADVVVWVNTIKEGRFDDTNKMFVKPDKYDYHVTTQDAKNWAPKIIKEIK